MKGNLAVNVLIYHLWVLQSPQVIEQQSDEGSRNSPQVLQTSQGILFPIVCAFTPTAPIAIFYSELSKVSCFTCANFIPISAPTEGFVPCSQHSCEDLLVILRSSGRPTKYRKCSYLFYLKHTMQI